MSPKPEDKGKPNGKGPGSRRRAGPKASAGPEVETEAERVERAERLTKRMEALEAEFIRRQAEFERAGPPHPGGGDSGGGHGGPFHGGPLGDDIFGGFRDFFPEQARSHFVNAQREWALALRDLVQYWIDRSAGADDRRPPPDRPKVM